MVASRQRLETPGLFPPTQNNPVISSSVAPMHRSAYPAMPRQPEGEKPPEVFLTGVTMVGDKAVVYLSNGDVFTSDDKELEFASKRMAIVSGKKFVFAPPMSSGKEVSAPPRDLFRR